MNASSGSNPPGTDVAKTVKEAIESRRSVRAFLPVEIPQATIEEILELAHHAPSGGNMQPWKVHVVMGKMKAAIEASLLLAAKDKAYANRPEYDYYPEKWQEPYASRRKEIGEKLHQFLDIGRRDIEARRAQHLRNFSFFGAPVGLFFCVDRTLSEGSWIDVGMFMQNVMTAARSFGLHTCPQASFTSYHQVVRQHLGISETDILLCGMSLGFEDKRKPENRLRSTRIRLEEFATFHHG